MRVLLSTDTVGGVWDHTVELARRLHDDGHDVLCAVIGEPRDERLAHLPPGVEVTWRDHRLEWMPDAAADVFAAGAWMRATSALWAADVVHLNQMAYAAHPFAAPVVTVVHSDVLSWFREVRGEDAPPADWAAYTRWVREGLAASEAVVAPTRYQADLVLRHYGREVDRVVHNGIAAPADAERGDLPPVLLNVGRAWDMAKGVSVLDRALDLLGDDAPEAHLLGETAAPHGERVETRRLTAHGRVERADVDAWMRRAGVYVAPSLYEPFGLAPLEAAMHGCALVLSDAGSFRELWDGCALFHPRGDAEALADALSSVCGDAKLRARLGSGARTRALRRYTGDRMAAAYLELYHDLTHGAGAARRPTMAAQG